MTVSLDARDLVVVSWEIELEHARALVEGLEPCEIEGRHLVSVVGLRYPRFSQLNVRTYVEWQGGQAVYFLRSWVTALGLPAALLGAPFGGARLRVRRGAVAAPGVGVSLRYEPGEPADSGPLGRHEIGLFRRGGLRSFTVRRGPAEWQRAELVEPPRADPLLSLGLELTAEPSVLYTPEASFVVDARPRRVDSRA